MTMYKRTTTEISIWLNYLNPSFKVPSISKIKILSFEKYLRHPSHMYTCLNIFLSIIPFGTTMVDLCRNLKMVTRGPTPVRPTIGTPVPPIFTN